MMREKKPLYAALIQHLKKRLNIISTDYDEFE